MTKNAFLYLVLLGLRSATIAEAAMADDLPVPRPSVQSLHDAGQRFQFAAVRFDHCFLTEESRRETMRSYGWLEHRLAYQFLTDLPPGVLGVSGLRVTSVVLADGTRLPTDAVMTAGDTFRGKQRGFASAWGLNLSTDRRYLLVDVVVDLAEIRNLKRVDGEFVVRFGGGSPTVEVTGLIEDRVGARDEVKGIVVLQSDPWGTRARHFILELPPTWDEIATVEAFDEQGQSIDLGIPDYFKVLRFEGRPPRLKLYLAQRARKPFSLRLTRPGTVVDVTVPFTISDVIATPAHGR